MNTIAEIKEILAHCYGSTVRTRHALAKNIIFTSGVDSLRQMCDAFWLVDDIAISYLDKNRRANLIKNGIHFWTLKKDAGGDTFLHCDKDVGDPYDKKVIPYTDFPFEAFNDGECKIWVEIEQMEEDGPINFIMYLPSER